MIDGFTNSSARSGSAFDSLKLTYGVIAALGLISLGVYAFVFRPITQDLLEMELNLAETRGRIAENGFGQIDPRENSLDGTQSKIDEIQQLEDQIYARITLRPGLEDLLSAPFRVLEFEQRRFDIQQRLIQLARERESSLPPDLLAGLPSYSNTTENQQLLWLHLEFFNHVMGALLSSGRGLRIEQAATLPIQIPGEASEAESSLFLVQMQLKVEGPATALATFLNASLPENEAVDSAIGEKAYSIDRMSIQSDLDGGDGRVILDTRLTGFILTNGPL